MYYKISRIEISALCTTLIPKFITTMHTAHQYGPFNMTSERIPHAGFNLYIVDKHTETHKQELLTSQFYEPSRPFRCLVLTSSYYTLPNLVPRNTCAYSSAYDATAPRTIFRCFAISQVSSLLTYCRLSHA